MRTYLIASTILFILIFASCKNEDEILIIEPVIEPIVEPVVEPVIEPIHYLALGDSYTIGQGVEESERWPNQLSQKLEENDYEVVRTEIIAQTGWQTSDLLNAMENNELEGYNLVSLLIGVNNQFWSQPFEMFNTEFDLLLDQSIDLAGGKGRVFVLSIPDYGVTPFGSNNSEEIAAEIDMYNQYIEQRCIEEDISFINITGISRELGDSEGALASDNLHPSDSQYAEWVEKTFPKVEAILME